jgi:hypothetical protein
MNVTPPQDSAGQMSSVCDANIGCPYVILAAGPPAEQRQTGRGPREQHAYASQDSPRFPNRDPNSLALLRLGCVRGMGLRTPPSGVSAMWLRHSEARAQVSILRDLVRVNRPGSNRSPGESLRSRTSCRLHGCYRGLTWPLRTRDRSRTDSPDSDEDAHLSARYAAACCAASLATSGCRTISFSLPSGPAR